MSNSQWEASAATRYLEMAKPGHRTNSKFYALDLTANQSFDDPYLGSRASVSAEFWKGQ